MSDCMILRGGRVIDPAANRDDIADVGILDGILVPPEGLSSCPVHDVAGLVVAPGFIDLHVHLRDPGQTHKEDIASGTRAAAAGGFTTIVAMPNTSPVVDCPEVLEDILARAAAHAIVRVLHSACLSRGAAGGDLTDMVALRDAGAVMLTDDGRCIQDEDRMREAVLRAKSAGLIVGDHCESAERAAGGVLHAGSAAREMGLPGIPHAAEDEIVARNIRLAEETGWHIHIQHVSTAGAVELLRAARSRGVAVSAEATPHHICLTDTACLEYGTNAKMNPPLRQESDRLAVIKGLRDGTIGALATDHAPHAAEEKARPFAQAPFGIIGLETAVPLCLTELHRKGVLSLPQLVALFTCGPRDILGLPCGTLAIGSQADITIFDPDAEHTLDVAASQSKSRNCPFHGWHCRGRVCGTIVGGRWVFRA